MNANLRKLEHALKDLRYCRELWIRREWIHEAAAGALEDKSIEALLSYLRIFREAVGTKQPCGDYRFKRLE